MGLFRRISDIISANLNDLTDQLEDPERMLKQAIREMEQMIAEATTETAKVIADGKLLEKEYRKNEQQASDWQRKAEQAVSAGDDQLALKALSRRQEHQKLATALQDQLEGSREASRTLTRQLEGMQAKLAEAKRSLSTLVARKRAADFQKRAHQTAAQADVGLSSDNAFAKLDRMREKVERAEAEAEALAELRGVKRSAAESEQADFPDTSDDLDDELQALKDKLRP